MRTHLVRISNNENRHRTQHAHFQSGIAVKVSETKYERIPFLPGEA